MTKLKRLEILLSNPQVVYFPGQTIEGQVVVELTDDMKMRGLRIKCHGEGQVYWTSGSGDDEKIHTAFENYIDSKIVLYGNDSSSSEDIVLNAGNHMFPFQFVLPLGIPGSFEGKSSCYVRYWLKASIDKPWKFDEEFKMLLSVGSVLDLNAVPNAMAPQQSTESETVCCCCCESSPINATFRIDKTGYVPGESIICNAEINEGTGRGVRSSKIKLIMWNFEQQKACSILQNMLLQVTTYKTHGHSTTRRASEVARLQHGSIVAGGSDVWAGERLQIPPVPPSYLPGCSIIIIDYLVQLEIDVTNAMFEMELPLSVVIGTIPPQAVVQQYMPQLPSDTVTNQPLGFQAPVNFDLPPPTYQECFQGKVDTKDDNDKNAGGNMQFAPAYTYYNWMNHPGPSAPGPTAT